MNLDAIEAQVRASGPFSVPCPFCKASKGDPCVRRHWDPKQGGEELVPMSDHHQARITAAEARASELQKLLEWERGCQAR